jgi:hypothetical protein
MSGGSYRLLVSAAAAVLIGLSALAMAAAHADPSAAGSTPTTSRPDDLADMVMAVIDQRPAAPTTTVVSAPSP